MKPNIENVLKQGVAAYKEGNIKDAEKLYRAILNLTLCILMQIIT